MRSFRCLSSSSFQQAKSWGAAKCTQNTAVQCMPTAGLKLPSVTFSIQDSGGQMSCVGRVTHSRRRRGHASQNRVLFKIPKHTSAWRLQAGQHWSLQVSHGVFCCQTMKKVGHSQWAVVPNEVQGFDWGNFLEKFTFGGWFKKLRQTVAALQNTKTFFSCVLFPYALAASEVVIVFFWKVFHLTVICFVPLFCSPVLCLLVTVAQMKGQK